MGTLYLVRHGQASFGADDYDKLSDLGHRQCVRLGEYFRDKGVRFVREPAVHAYGTVAVFEDLYGNRWDLVQFADAHG